MKIFAAEFISLFIIITKMYGAYGDSILICIAVANINPTLSMLSYGFSILSGLSCHNRILTVWSA